MSGEEGKGNYHSKFVSFEVRLCSAQDSVVIACFPPMADRARATKAEARRIASWARVGAWDKV